MNKTFPPLRTPHESRAAKTIQNEIYSSSQLCLSHCRRVESCERGEKKSKTIPAQQVTINHSHTMRCDTKSVIPSINYIFDT